MLAALYALAILVMTAYGINLLWLSLHHARLDHAMPQEPERPAPARHEDWPHVTVQLPLYNEAYVAERLIDACAQLDYPRRCLEIQVLDDSTDETTKLTAERVAYWQQQGLDISHLQRDERTGYKAGALQHGLQQAAGSLVAVFDADFVPPSDFLRRTVPHFFDAPRTGMVQARWGHLNADASLLTRLQALGLDVHFAIEQYVRNRIGCFINFNGTAGVWRTRCIRDAGGWEGDTLTEDLDLSYRAQLRGWSFKFLPAVEVPAELPASMNALRAQQFRWAKGAVETTRKLLGRLWHSTQPLRVKLEGTFHLTAHFVFPFVLIAALLHAPLLALEALGHGPGDLYFAAMSGGLFGFIGLVLSHVLAQRRLYPDWKKRLRDLPLFIAGSMGLALSNTRAVWQALRGRRSAFTRTPKHNSSEASAGEGIRREHRYLERWLPPIAWLEAGLALYSTVGFTLLTLLGEWAALPFQGLFSLGFGLVAASSMRQYWENAFAAVDFNLFDSDLGHRQPLVRLSPRKRGKPRAIPRVVDEQQRADEAPREAAVVPGEGPELGPT